MLNTIRRWFSGASGASWTGASQWAQARGYAFKRSRDGDGFVIEPTGANPPWRLEWGPSQRPYIEGPELRLRAVVRVRTFLQLLR